ncbi:TauD/TfdA family dioxygenase [Jatrophihabitans endophyticus]|uniref:TauD/TfdA dioxygenase family protein n=1 Tax=Jatrophihabitans endophyticus TaxID=1206085 RepID=UPI0019FE9593|nr:TauD/TfdA family dioxygenase [Jatrophihabitans endophyticus]MBE7187090.1 TauD/TfdA family dioxygenase [Jatrophihabitans endophyticus]
MTAQLERPADTLDHEYLEGYEAISVRKVGANLGAEIGNVRVGGDVPAEQIGEIKRALAQNKVVFFRDQLHAGDAEQRAFAALLGTVTKPHPTVAGDGEAVLPIDSDRSKANSWHTDVTFIDRIPSASILRAVHLPPYGGTTVWANSTRAYNLLHPALQALVEKLWAVHSNLYDYAAERDEKRIGGIDVKEQAYRDEFGNLEFETEHPVVRIHPVTGEKTLVLGHFIRYFVGFSSHDSSDLFNLLQRHVTKLDNTVRWNWRLGDIAIWDNMATQHYAVDDYDDRPRRLHRITLAGEIPVSVDGVRSSVRKGDASHFSPIAS